MDDLLQEFLTETNESIAEVDLELVNLEKNPDNPELIDNIFRLVHTIKGTCGFLGLPRLESVAHAGENVLGKFRDKELVVTPDAVTLILQAIDRIKEILEYLEANEAEPEGDDSDLIARLNAMAAGEKAPSSAPADAGGEETAPAPAEAEETAAVAEAVSSAEEEAPAPEEKEEKTFLKAGDYDPQLGRKLRPGEVSMDELERAFQEAEGPEIQEAKAEPAAKTAKAEESPAAKKDVHKAASSIRVNVHLLEHLMTMVSELVLTRNQLLQMVRGMEDSEFTVPLQRLSHVTTELQEGVMKTRMQPIGNAWAKLPRIVRDLSMELNKKIDLQMLGADTELDRQVLELIKDPLTHMVRNSADHGMESPEERLAAGKKETGKIVLNAYHEGGHIIIEIADDGRGINIERVKQKALDNGLVTPGELEGMSDQQIQKFIFKPGFSTAEAVTSVSGRGVGMDVVRTNIEKIGGTIDLRSEEGKGSTFIIKIPLTLAIVSALIVESAGERFAVPQISVVELVRTSDRASDHKIETINNTPVLRLRERLLPLVHLHEVLELEKDPESDSSEDYIIVTQVGNYSFGIVVDRVFDTEEIVVKPVAPILNNIGIYSGNTILGDGSVVMILDPNGIAASTGEVTLSDTEEDTDAVRGAGSDDTTALLVFRAGAVEPKAVPLSLVARLEEIDVAQFERANNQLVVQYRGHLMPLVTVDPSYQIKTEGRQPILVFSDEERTMGLIVDEIVDIVEDKLDIELRSTGTRAILGTAVIGEHATEVIDVAYYLAQAFPDWFNSQTPAVQPVDESAPKVLLVDDSPFFRNMLTPLLQLAGYEVTTADNAADALQLREGGAGFDLIISDIEMPGMNGFEFAEAVKADGRWQSTPIVALSSHATPQDFDRGRQAGFTDYVAKFDREELLATLNQTLRMGGGAA